MNKLKELAFKQINQGSKEIDYQEIVKFIQKENGVFADDIKDRDILATQKKSRKDDGGNNCFFLQGEP